MKKTISFILACIMVVIMVLPVLPVLELPVHAAQNEYRFDYAKDSPVIVIDEQTVAGGITNFIIPDGAFSVTVSGNVDVTIVFESVVINRAEDGEFGAINSDSTLVSQLGDAGTRLGWGNYVPTCPFLITNGAKVHALFMGKCAFAAGVNGWQHNYSRITNGHNYRGGYAGIQIMGDSSLTIDGTADWNGETGSLQAYGGYQFFHVGGTDVKPEDFNPIRIPDGINNGTHGKPQYCRPIGTNAIYNSGGAGIGGGVSRTAQQVAGEGYTDGTPGEIIINGGDIKAVGGHQSAGIGGGINGAGTTSQIVINSGTVTAVGGRWASAIGDGDSEDGGASSQFTNPHKIIINGGKVKAYGGVAASGIGTTDAVTRKNETWQNKTHGLEISINGGEVIAQSGEADTDDPANTETATSAIGAGQDTNMKDNSITISAAADVQAVSFSKYAISNYGAMFDGETEIRKPTVNIDPDGYMYLARFTKNSVFSPNQVRTFSSYSVLADSFGNPMLVATDANAMMDPNFNTTYQGEYYALNREEGKYNGKYYLVNKDGTPKQMPATANGEIDAKGRFYPTAIPALSYYFDTSKAIEVHTVPAKYKAIAMTLPDPSKAGLSGTYVIHVPDPKLNDGYSDDIYAVIQKNSPGTTSGEILPNMENGNVTQHHVPEGTNGKTEETPNVKPDNQALPFTDMHAYLSTDTGKTDDLIAKYNGDFYPSVFAYTVYIPRDINAYNFDFKFENKENVTVSVSIVTNATITGRGKTVLNGNTLTGGTLSKNKKYLTHHLQVDMTGIDHSELWITKQDSWQDSNGQWNTATVVYKITAIRKPQYELGFNDMNKVYDGVAPKANVNAMFLPGGGFSAPVIQELGEKEGTASQDSMQLPPASELSYTTGKDYDPKYLIGNKKEHIEIIYKIEQTEEMKFKVTAEFVGFATYTIFADMKNQVLGPTQSQGPLATGSFEIEPTINTKNAKIDLVSHGRLAGTELNRINVLTISLSQPQNGNSIPSDELDINVQNATEALKQEMIQNKLTSASKIVSGKVRTQDTTLSASINMQGKNLTVTSLSTKSYEGTKQITLNATYNQDFTEELKKLPSSAIQYTYHTAERAADGKNQVTGDLPQAPKDAGFYAVTAKIKAEKYEAEGTYYYEIRKREIYPQSIQNWRHYLDDKELQGIQQKTLTKLNISDPGEIYYYNVVPGETITLEPKAITGYCYYYEGGSPLSISQHDSKITLDKVRILQDAYGKNYVFPANKAAPDDGNYYTFKVAGELAYKMDDAIFRREEDGPSSEPEKEWDKFWPVSETTPLDFTEGADDHRIDYHSPHWDMHREHVYLTAVNNGKVTYKYAVDLEFGSMQFTFSKTIWDVNTHTYLEVKGQSQWSGNDGNTNRVTVSNRSNQPIYYAAGIVLDTYYGRGCISTLQRTSSNILEPTATQKLASQKIKAVDETQPAGQRQPQSDSFYVFMSGVPQVSVQNGGRSTGILTVRLSMNEIPPDEVP